MKEKEVIVITGPTAVGKTHATLAIAEKLDLEIISCDSRQFYKEMNIGTAKPSPEELAHVPHHFINSLSIQEEYSAGDFERDGLKVLCQCFSKHDQVILSGGSGLYIKALCEGLNHFPDVPKNVFEAVSKLPINALQEELERSDPQYFIEVDLQNRHRLIRAISVIRTSGQSFSSYRQHEQAPRNFKTSYYILNRDRSELYERINQRVDKMLEQGLVEEAKALFPFRNTKALQTVGYAELFAYFEGTHDLKKAIELIKRNSRRYAKRQLTWFRKLENAQWFHPEEILNVLT